MNNDIQNDRDDVLDGAVSARLARLRTMPVDVSNLDRALRAKIPPVSQRRVLFMRPLRAIAASLVLVSAITAVMVISFSGDRALAEPAAMAQVHLDIVSGKTPVMQVHSIEAANQMLNSQSPGAPALPQLPDSHVMACCMKSVHDKKMACLLLNDGGVPITLAVASAADMKLAPIAVTIHNGVEYRVQSFGDLNMVMTEQNGKWLCLIGQTSADHLMDIAAQVRF